MREMKSKTAIAIFISLVVPFLTGCPTIPEVNQSFQRVDNMWLQEYRQMEETVRTRIVEGSYPEVLTAAKKALSSIGFAVEAAQIAEGKIVGVADEPTPLTKDEWIAVVREEKSRVSDVGGWYMQMSEKPVGYKINVRVDVTPTVKGTVIKLGYEMSHPEYASMGINANKAAPPTAVRIGSERFWGALAKELTAKQQGALRVRSADEMGAEEIDRSYEGLNK